MIFYFSRINKGAIDHYKDICIIEKMLKKAGFKLVIAHLYEEEEYCNIPDIPLIKVKHTKNIPDNNWQFHSKNYRGFFIV
jgi:hypothetical protein